MPPLTAESADLLIHKGETIAGPGYSGFEQTSLAEKLSPLAVQDVAVCGVATEYCVRATAVDGAKAGFHVSVLTDLIRPVQPSAVEPALQEMAALGIAGTRSKAWLASGASSLAHQNPRSRPDA